MHHGLVEKIPFLKQKQIINKSDYCNVTMMDLFEGLNRFTSPNYILTFLVVVPAFQNTFQVFSKLIKAVGLMQITVCPGLDSRLPV